MGQRVISVVVVFLVTVFGARRVMADGEGEAPPAAVEPESAPPAAEHEAPAPAEHPDEAAPAEHEDRAGRAAALDEAAGEAEHDADQADADDDDGEPPTSEFDPEGTGKPDVALENEFDQEFVGVPKTIETDEVDKELEARPPSDDLKPSITDEQLRSAVQTVRKVVLGKMEKKIANGTAKKMRWFSTGIFLFSLLGVVLLVIPLAVGKKYPGKAGILFKYSALAAVTFFVTVNLFGGVLMALRTVQGALGPSTNPSLAIAKGTFDSLDRNADEFVTMGKEVFMPTLEQLAAHPDEQPAEVLLENGQKVIKDARVFVTCAHMFKKIDFIFKILPIVLFAITMLLFFLAVKPTLTEIVKLPMRAASGEAGVGRDVTRKAMRRVWGELLATLCTVGVLVVMTVLSAFVLGQIVGPALDALLDYFSRAVTYLMFVEGASSGLVFLALFGVIFFLALNLAALILSTAFFLGKCQKIFQARFNDGTPIAAHKRFFKWGIASVLLVQVLPWIYALIADVVLHKIDASSFDGVTSADQVPWTKVMLAGPIFLIVGFVFFFWAARGIKGIKFLATYKVKPKAPRARPSAPAREDVQAI